MTDPATFATSRLLPRPPEAVFGAFSDAARLASWWGPDGFSNEFESFDFRVGGAWRLVMVGPDGTRYRNESVFTAVEPGGRVTVDHLSPPRFTLTVELTPVPGGTRVTWTQVFADAAVAAAIRPIVEPANEQNLDRLGAVLAAAGKGA